MSDQHDFVPSQINKNLFEITGKVARMIAGFRMETASMPTLIETEDLELILKGLRDPTPIGA